jgi:hypothetical protein
MTFLVMSMPSVWRNQRAKIPHLEEYLLGAFMHEMTHTQQLVPINRRLRQLIGSTELLGRLNDDVIQERFGKEQGFARPSNANATCCSARPGSATRHCAARPRSRRWR